MPFSASSRNAAGISTFGMSNLGISNFGMSNLGISNFGISKADPVTATGLAFAFGVAVEMVSAMIVILGSEGGFPPKMSRRDWHNGSRVYSSTRRRKGASQGV